MMTLEAPQADGLAQLALARDLARVQTAVASLLPELGPGLEGDLTPHVRRAWEIAQGFGWTHGLCIARLLAAWAAFGLEMERRPEYAWALALLQQATPEGLGAHQFGRRCVEVLRADADRKAAAEVFERALGRLDAELAGTGRLGSLFPREPLHLAQACDLAHCSVELVVPEWRRQYVVREGRWQFEAAVPPAASVEATPGTPLPQALYVLADEGEGPAARLCVRSTAQSCCDARFHPRLSLRTPRSHREWPGALAAQVVASFSGATSAPGIAVEGGSLVSELALASCGLRDSGVAMGSQSTWVVARSSRQRCLSWRREAGERVRLPGPPPSHATAVQVRAECDGQPQDALRWQHGLSGLDSRLHAGLQAIWAAWSAVDGLKDPQLRAQPAVMAGDAGVAWGWAEGEQPLSQPPFMRVAAAMDLVLWQVELRLTGLLALPGASALVLLRADGAAGCLRDVLRAASQADLTTALAPLQVDFHQPFVLEARPLLGESPGLLRGATLECGAVRGSAGLRCRLDGPGLEWFVKAEVEPVVARFEWRDPLCGEHGLSQPLLPALPLVDWSLS